VTMTPESSRHESGTSGAAELKAAAHTRQSFVRHELRAPLAVLYPLLSLLVDGGAGELTAHQRELLTVLERNVTRLEALVTGLTESGWAECSPAGRVAEAVPLDEVAREVLSLRQAVDHDLPLITIEVDSRLTAAQESGVPSATSAMVDRDDVRLIIGALLRNAAAFSPDNGAITVQIVPGRDPDTIAVEVIDNGPGMPAEELARAGEFGFRGKLARERQVPGLGIGLWVCRELAARNGGSLELTAADGGGVHARVTLPRPPAG
jgi:signal transduction histidine kinase